MHKALSVLMQEGLEPDSFSPKSIRYSQGKWEEKLSHIGRYLDLKLPFTRKMRAYLK